MAAEDIDSNFINTLINDDLHQEEEDTIREPDDYTKEVLGENINQDELDLEFALKLSLKDINTQNIVFEDKLLDNFNKEKEQRRELFKNMLLQIQKVSRYDKELNKVFDILSSILDMYYEQLFISYELDYDTYDLIFSNLKSVRINDYEIDLLKSILICSLI